MFRMMALRWRLVEAFLELWLGMEGKICGDTGLWPYDIGNRCECASCGSYGCSPID